MPIAWESPKRRKIDPYIASILATYLIDVKSKTPYTERSIKNPVEEITEEDLKGDFLPSWWLFMTQKLREYKEHKQEEKKKEEAGETSIEHWSWVPSLYLWGSVGLPVFKKYLGKITEADLDKAREELGKYIGFRAYAYRKTELGGYIR